MPTSSTFGFRYMLRSYDLATKFFEIYYMLNASAAEIACRPASSSGGMSREEVLRTSVNWLLPFLLFCASSLSIQFNDFITAHGTIQLWRAVVVPTCSRLPLPDRRRLPVPRALVLQCRDYMLYLEYEKLPW
eukprot:321359-Pleurochrysis_carterae.AAC.2